MDTGSGDPAWPELAIVDMGAHEYPVSVSGDLDEDGIDDCADNCPAHFNPDQHDCDDDGVGDCCAVAYGLSPDCNENLLPDECDLADGQSQDADDNQIPDECQRVFYVNTVAPPGGDGTSWATAFEDLQDALNVATAGDQIWVAAGAYVPTVPVDADDPRTATFSLPNAVRVYGGFAGHETSTEERNPSVNPTILSGDRERDDDPNDESRDDNCHHVVTVRHGDERTALDGFIISGGHADASWSYAGGGAYLAGTRVTLTNCVFSDNRAEYYGGGMAARYNSSPTVTNCAFVGNLAQNRNGRGGGLYSDYSGRATLIDCSFTDNFAGAGGGMYAGDCALTACIFDDNQAGTAGGAYVYGNSVLCGCTFRGNSATYSSGGLLSNSFSDTQVRNSTFIANYAAEDGGGVGTLNSSVLTFTDCTFFGNWAGDSCGGAHSDWSGTLRFEGCTFAGNTASDNGGGICSSRGELELVNTVLNGNSAAGDGGAIYLDSYADATLIGCTLAANSALNGSAVGCDSRNQSYPSVLSIANSILWNGGDEIWNNDGSAITVTYNIVDGGYGGPDQHNIDANPLFVRNPDDGGDGWGDDPVTPGIDEGANDDRGNLRLSIASPCIDAGNNDALLPGLLTDLDGGPRRFDEPTVPDTGSGAPPIVDMGAFEWSDCNQNAFDDGYEIANGTAEDCNDSGILDECEISDGSSQDLNGNGVPDECEPVIVSSTPPSGSIDARQPHGIHNPSKPCGWDTMDFRFGKAIGSLTAGDFSVTEFGGDGVSPTIVAVESTGLTTYQLVLSEPIEPGTWTMITHEQSKSRVCLGYLPGDVDGNGSTTLDDLDALLALLNAEAGRAGPIHSADLNRSGIANAQDFLRLVDLMNGADAFESWLGLSIGSSPCSTTAGSAGN